MQNLGLLVADRIRVERNRRLHRGQADQLHDVVRYHVAQRARMIEITAASFHAYRFRHRDLYMVDVAAVPDRLENSVGESERHDVLHGFFAEIMVDAVNLFLVSYFQQLLIQLLGRFQIVPERFFNHNPAPVIVALLH